MSAEPIYFDDLHVGRVLETGWYEMTREAIVAFAGEYDPQPFHLSDEGGLRSAFGELVASGIHTFSVFNKLRLAAEPGLVVAAGLGFEKLRFLAPVHPGDRLRVRGSCTEKRPSKTKPDRGVVGFHHKVVNQHDQVVMETDFCLMISRRPEDV